MFKKINIRTLAILFVVLLAIVALIEYSSSKKGDRSFRDKVLSFENEQITAIAITDYKTGEEQLNLEKTGEDEWKVKTGEKTYNADPARIEEVLNQLAGLEPISMVATTKDKWAEYQVTDSAALSVKLMDDGKTLANLMVGKFSYKQPENPSPYQRGRGEMTSYVRLEDEKQVFAVEGFLRMNLNPDPTAFRDKTVIQSDRNNWTKLAFSYPDHSFNLNRQGKNWMVDGLAADSSSVASYLSNISSLSNTSFIDESELGSENPTHSLTISGTNMASPVQIKAFPASAQDTTNTYYITSSLNKGTYFAGNKTELFDKLFKNKDYFLPGE